MKTLYYNGDIITMENDSENVNAIFCSENIIKCGDYQKLKHLIDAQTVICDLQGATLMPSFYDCHSHILGYALTMGMVDLRLACSFAQIIDLLLSNQDANDEWLIGYGYNIHNLTEKTHPNKQILNQVSQTRPILITDVSGHSGVMNDKALEMLNVQEEEIISSGYLEESTLHLYTKDLTTQDIKQTFNNLNKAYQIYASNGITTAQEGCCDKSKWEILEKFASSHQLLLDTVAYLDIRDSIDLMASKLKYTKYNKNLKIGGYKLFLDGSPLNQTAWMKEKYLNTDHHGFPNYSFEQAKVYFRKAKEETKQLIVHANGSAACKQMIELSKEVGNSYTRPVMIHSQFLDLSDMEQLREEKIITSFFVSHIYHFGDIHIEQLGSRAEYISPVKSAIENEIIYTFHQDTPVLPPNIFELIDCAVNRTTKEGKVFEKEKISVYDALKAVTINGAFQYFEEDIKGSIKEGKQANFIILDKNPLKIPTNELKNIQILKTIKENKVIYQK